MNAVNDQDRRIAELERQLAATNDELAAARAQAPLLNALLRDIAERKRIEAQLTESQQWLHLAHDAAGVAAYAYDFAAGRLSWSPSAFSLYGVDPAVEPTIELWLSVVHPDDRDAVAAVAARTLERGSDVDHEFRLLRPDGSVRWVHDRGRVLLDENGRPARLVGLDIDVTAQRAAADELRDREERLRAALAGSGAGTFRWNIATDDLDWDSELDRLFGLPPGETPRSLDEFIAHLHPDDRDAVAAACRRCASQGADFEMTFRAVRPDGTHRWIYDRGRTYRDAAGEPSYMTGACIDVTERREAMARLSASEELLRLAQEAGGVGTFEWFPDTDEVVGTAEYHRLWGLDPEEPIKGSRLVDMLHPDDRPLSGPARFDDPASALDYVEYRIFRADTGEMRWLARRGRMVTPADGGRPRLVGALYDVTDRRNAERRLQTVLESITDGFLGIDAGWRITLFNAAAERYFGQSRTDVIGRSFWEVFADHRGTEFEARFREVMRSRQPIRFEVASIRHPGRIAELKVAPKIGGGIAINFSDITERRRTEDALAESVRDLGFALKAGKLGGWTLDLVTNELTTSEICRTNFGRDPDIDFTYAELLDAVHPDDRDRMRAAVERSIASGDDYDIEYRVVTPAGETRWVAISGRPIRVAGKAVRMTGISLDITKRKLDEEHRQLLVGELSHRVKNILGIVQATAHQTFGGSKTPDEVRQAFEGRLAALARAQDVLTQQSWDTVLLRDLLDRTLAPFVQDADGRIGFDGPALRLQAKTAVSFALAVHELATNASKYGALSSREGRVLIRWWLVRTGDGARLKLYWQERGGPPVAAPSRRGFGSRMIERALATELQGTVRIEFDREGVCCSIDAPLPYLGADPTV